MIPAGNTALTDTLEVFTQPSKQYRMDMDAHRIVGVCDGLEAVRQAVFKILSTERFETLIYSWDYGIERNGIYGKPPLSACAMTERAVGEALLQDDRITAVDGFTFDTSKRGVIHVSFVVHTIFGDLSEVMEI